MGLRLTLGPHFVEPRRGVVLKAGCARAVRLLFAFRYLFVPKRVVVAARLALRNTHVRALPNRRMHLTKSRDP